jgi:hypothetical protein
MAHDTSTDDLVAAERRKVMRFHLDASDTDYAAWLASHPSEDELRDAYFVLETARACLWTPGHIDSFRRDRYEVDQRLVQRLVQVKRALADAWAESGQIHHLLR